MRFRITIHSGHGAPDDAIELLWRRLGVRQDEVSFGRHGWREIRASRGEDEGRFADGAERRERERRAVFEIVRDICEPAPELEADWFAVAPIS